MSMKNAVLASAVASLFLSGAAFAKEKDAKKTSQSVMCEGINGCKGHGGCKSASNACKGQNGCKGQGVTETNSDVCKANGGKVQVATKQGSSLGEDGFRAQGPGSRDRAPPEALRTLLVRIARRGLGGSDQRELPRSGRASVRRAGESAGRGSRRAARRVARHRVRRSARRAAAA